MSGESLSPDELMRLFEAARWAAIFIQRAAMACALRSPRHSTLGVVLKSVRRRQQDVGEECCRSRCLHFANEVRVQRENLHELILTTVVRLGKTSHSKASSRILSFTEWKVSQKANRPDIPTTVLAERSRTTVDSATAYADAHFEDPPDIRDWIWTDGQT
jgi:hypothetical protein